MEWSTDIRISVESIVLQPTHATCVTLTTLRLSSHGSTPKNNTDRISERRSCRIRLWLRNASLSNMYNDAFAALFLSCILSCTTWLAIRTKPRVLVTRGAVLLCTTPARRQDGVFPLFFCFPASDVDLISTFVLATRRSLVLGLGPRLTQRHHTQNERFRTLDPHQNKT